MKQLLGSFLSLVLLNSSMTCASEAEGKSIIPYIGKPGQHEISLNITADTLKDALSMRYKTLFNGRSESGLPYIKDLRTTYASCKSESTFITPHTQQSFVQYRNQVQEMARTHPQLEIITQELDHDIKLELFDCLKLHSYTLRILGAISDAPTKDALSVFKDYNGEKVDTSIRTNWKSPFAIFALDDDGVYSRTIRPFGLSDRLQKELDSIIDNKSKRPSIYYTVFGKAKLGLGTLIESFIKRIYPLPIATRQLTAHGITMTPLLFGYHDYLHGTIDLENKSTAIETASYDKLESIAGDKLNADQLLEPIADYMLEKSYLIEDTLSSLFDLYFTYYLPQHSMAGLKKVMVGFFHVLHEDFNISPEIFDMSNFDDILKVFLNECPSQNEDDDIVNDMDDIEEIDILNTDPLTGKTSLSPEQVLDAILESGLPANEQRYFPTPEFRFKRSDLEGTKYRIDIKDEPMLTTVTVKLPKGVEYTWEIVTLKYLLANAKDAIALLKIAGIKMTPPAIQDLASPNGREIALAFLEEAKKNLEICKDAFKTSAFELLGVVPNGEHKSLWRKFWDKSQKLDKKLEMQVENID